MSARPNRCAFHPDRSSVFRCRTCESSYCEECRAPERRNACVRCDMVVGVRESADQEPDEVPEVGIARKRRFTPFVIGALLAVSLGMGIWWAVNHARTPPQVEEAFDAIDAVSRAVERSRDASGLVPPTLDGILAKMPAEAAALVRNGQVRYRPSTDRRTFAIEAVFDQRVPQGTAEEDAS